MRFLRLTTNSLLSGLFFSLLLALLIYDLNINLVFKPAVLVALTLYLMLTFGFLAFLLCLVVASVHRFFSGKNTPPEFVSPSFLTLSFSLFILLFLVLFRENFVYFLSFYVPGLQSWLRAQMVLFFVLAVAGLLLHFQYHHRKARRAYFGVFFVLLGAALAFAIGLRLSFPFPAKEATWLSLEPKKIVRKVTVLSFEGLSLDVLTPLINERKLPNFSSLMESGSWGRLRGFTPSDPFVLERTFGTGMLPGKHRQVSAVQYRIPVTRERLEVVPRFMLFRQLTRFGLLDIVPTERSGAVKDIWTIFADFQASVVKRSTAAAGPIPEAAKARPDQLFATFYKDFLSDTSPIFSQVRQAFALDASVEDEAFQARSQTNPQLFTLWLEGANTADMFFYKYSFPDAFGDIRQEEIQKNGTVIEKYCQFYDQVIGRYLASLKDNELLIVYSPYGTEPLPFWKRIVEWVLGNSDVSAYHEQAPDGVVFIRGQGIVRGRNIDAIRLVDLAPTILYFVGLPVGKDMDGVVRGTLFNREFTDENPVLTISSYEAVTVGK